MFELYQEFLVFVQVGMELRKIGFMICLCWYFFLFFGLFVVVMLLVVSDIQQVLFNFVKLMVVVGIIFEDVDLFSVMVEVILEGDIFCCVIFSLV